MARRLLYVAAMGFIDIILGIFGGKRKVDFAKIDPDDLEVYWRVDHEVDQAERKGPAELAAVLAQHGLRDKAHWEQISSALHERHGNNPEFKMACPRVMFEVQLASMQGYTIPQQYIAPPHGITLDRYATIKARVDLGQPLPQVLPSYALDVARWGEVDQTWDGRMGPQADFMAGQILRTQYQVMYQAATAAYGGK